jgi:hypothetical protein
VTHFYHIRAKLFLFASVFIGTQKISITPLSKGKQSLNAESDKIVIKLSIALLYKLQNFQTKSDHNKNRSLAEKLHNRIRTWSSDDPCFKELHETEASCHGKIMYILFPL